MKRKAVRLETLQPDDVYDIVGAPKRGKIIRVGLMGVSTYLKEVGEDGQTIPSTKYKDVIAGGTMVYLRPPQE